MSKQICVIAGAPLSLSDKGGSFVYNILPVGKFHTRGYGGMEITSKLVQEMAANFGKHPAYPVPIKLGHGDGAPSPGVVKTAEARPDGLYITFEVDEQTASAIRGRQYRYMSAEYDTSYPDKSGASVGGVMVGAALVNQPGHPSVAPFMLSDLGEENNGKVGNDMNELEELKKRNAELETQLKDKAEAAETKKLSDELAETRQRENALLDEIAKQKRETRKVEVKALSDAWKKGGVPPVLVDKLAPLMLAEGNTIKLADGKEQSAFDVIKDALDNMPKVDMSGVSLSDRVYVSPTAGAGDYNAGAEAAKKMNEGRN